MLCCTYIQSVASVHVDSSAPLDQFRGSAVLCMGCHSFPAEESVIFPVKLLSNDNGRQSCQESQGEPTDNDDFTGMFVKMHQPTKQLALSGFWFLCLWEPNVCTSVSMQTLQFQYVQ